MRAKRTARAFVASADLRPMAQQLLEARTPAAYAGVEKFARAHAQEDAGALAWMVIGYAHILDAQFALAIAPLRKAQARAGALADYVDFFLASAQGATGDARGAIATLHNFDGRYPDSLFSKDAAVIAGNAMLATGDRRGAIALLESHNDPPRADVELVLGRAEIASGNLPRAVAILRQVYYRTPLAPEAAPAEMELQKIGSAAIAPPTFADRKFRASELLERNRAGDAAQDFKALLEDAPAEERDELSLDLAQALGQSRHSRDAMKVLRKMPDPGGELGARRRYYLLELSRPDEQAVGELITQLRNTSPSSPWLEQGLLASGNMYLLRGDNLTASRFFDELVARFPRGEHAAFANWRAGWLEFRLGETEAARQAFERQLRQYPDSAQASAAAYWIGYLAEQGKDTARARAFYTATIERFRNDYYSDVARERLRQMGPGTMDDDSLIASLPPPAKAKPFVMAAPEDDPRLQKSLLLENCGMIDFAVRELQAAANHNGANWSTASIVRLLTDTGDYFRALETLKRATPGYYSFTVGELPRPLWEGLFPKPYWEQIKRYSEENQLDPFLVASVIRQESEFNADAVSHARAMGLMQLLPQTGKKLAREEKLRHFAASMLLDPGTNVELGTRYLRHLLDKYDGQVEYALAAYNAGPDRVDNWKDAHYDDIHEFVESIPFSETRDYVQAVERNRGMYVQLYGRP
jgi:peptidoglycan lytic transglycosylase